MKKFLLVILSIVCIIVGAAVLGSDSQLMLEFRHSLALRLIPHSSAATLNVPGAGEFKMFLNPWDIALTPIIMFRGQWEPSETRWIVKSLKSGDTFIDVGANVGYYTMLASKIVGPEGRVYAFEPDPESFALLEENVRLNGLSNVVLEQKALSNESGTLKLYIAGKNRADHRIYNPDRGEERTAIEVEAVTLDEYFAGDDRPIDFIKIDTQGAEGVIFDGLQGIAAANPQLRIAIEWWPFGVEEMGFGADKLHSLITGLGFNFYEIGWLGLPRPLRRISAEDVAKKFSVKNGKMTNLLLTRADGPDIVNLDQPVP